MNTKLRTCSTCGKKYEFCPHCPSDANKPLWLFAWCSENCKDIYDITSKFEDGRLTAIEAKKELDKLDLSNSENFGQSYKLTIEKIDVELNSTSAVGKKKTYKKKPKIQEENISKKNYYKKSKATKNNVE